MIYISKEIRNAFNKVKEEMNEHLDSINANSNEINANHDYILYLEEMVTKLKERLDEVELQLSDFTGKKVMQAADFKDIVLNAREKEIFLMLYSRTGDLIDYREISKCLGYTESMAQKLVSSMIGKGIPVIKKYFDNNVYLVLDADFRNLQAKENIIN